MGRRNLLLCFDAFGTLFTPKRPIAEQYATVARQCGLDGFSTEQVKASFKAAFSGESKAHPNYGRASNMGAEQWWTNVINKTFQPFVGPSRDLPKDLAPKLLHRFSSSEGYVPHPGVVTLLRALKQQQQNEPQQNGFHRVVVGVITNSDDRVPSVLSSLGLRVSPLRFGRPLKLAGVAQAGQQFDIDLHCMSYDVGCAKPDRRIFDAAEGMANQLLAAQGSDDAAGVPWLKLYVGDEYEKDVLGAREAGWNSVLVGASEDAPEHENMTSVDELRGRPLEEVFPKDSSPVTIRTETTQALLEWLVNLSAEQSDS